MLRQVNQFMAVTTELNWGWKNGSMKAESILVHTQRNLFVHVQKFIHMNDMIVLEIFRPESFSLRT